MPGQRLSPPARAAALIALALGVAGLSMLRQQQRFRDQTPPRWRADRWERTPDGARARAWAEDRCGALEGDAWVDLPPQAEHPVLLDAPPAQVACFAEKVAPFFGWGAL